MTIQFTAQAKKQFDRLSPIIARKFFKQANFLLENPRHPSLRARKLGGEEKYEARIDRHNRFTYTIYENDLYILSIGPHDEGLGKK